MRAKHEPSLGNGVPRPPSRLAHGEVALRLVEFVPGDRERRFAPYYHFRIEVAGAGVGHLNLRVGETEHLRLVAGHIGYEVRPEHRGHGYAYQACQALAPFARLLRPETILTADPDNTPSLRTIERLGARLLDEVAIPPHEPAYTLGLRRKRRYAWVP